MKAMILAAGRGKRMMPLTQSTAKPALEVNGKPLIVYHIERLASAGIRDIVINLAWCAESIKTIVGDGRQFGVNIEYSFEGDEGLETAGGIINVLDKLNDTFIVINGDIFTDYDVASLTHLVLLPTEAHLVLVENPSHNPNGDFAIHNGVASTHSEREKYTFSGIALYHKSFFNNLNPGFLALAPILREKMRTQLVSAELYLGKWHDIGTPQRLEEINRMEANQ